MGNTIVEKILMRNTNKSNLKVGDIVTVNIDHTMVHDLFAPFVIEKFNEMGFEKVWDTDKIAFIYDHLVPTSFIEDSRHHKITDIFAFEQNIKKVHASDGVCHQLMPELRYATPGSIVIGTDSHTTTYGAVSALSTGIGYTEMAAVFGTGKLWFKVPPTLKFVIDGELKAGVTSKDVILKIIGDIGVDGATYCAMEFSGVAVRNMSIASRMTMCNMAVESGAKFGIVELDDKTCEFSGVDKSICDELKSDEDAYYEKVYHYNASEFSPMVACPSNVDNVKCVDEIQGLKIDQAFLGSCTNGRLEDLEIASKILEGKKIAPFLRFIVTPASRSVYKEALAKGYIDNLIRAGAIITHPSCSLCCGRSHGILADGERVLATNNRNFLGRMGSATSEVFLASPATVAASVIEGVITNPQKYL